MWEDRKKVFDKMGNLGAPSSAWCHRAKNRWSLSIPSRAGLRRVGVFVCKKVLIMYYHSSECVIAGAPLSIHRLLQGEVSE